VIALYLHLRRDNSPREALRLARARIEQERRHAFRVWCSELGFLFARVGLLAERTR
jgi:hypothetical protein